MPRSYLKLHADCYRVILENEENVASCLLAAPHGGGIEPTTSEIAKAVGKLSRRAVYSFEGLLPHGNEALHIDSTAFDEPRLLTLLAKTQFVLSFHGADRETGTHIYIGGRWAEGRRIFIERLNADLGRLGILAEDATAIAGVEEIAGVNPLNLTNRGRKGEGVQLEFSKKARLVFFPSLNRAGRQNPLPTLADLAASIDNALGQLTAE